MATTLEEILISVWRQALVEEARTVTVGDKSFPVRRTSRSRLREVDFQFEDHELRGLEQNPKTTSRWARLGTGREKGHAVPRRRQVRCGRRGWTGAVLRETRLVRMNNATKADQR